MANGWKITAIIFMVLFILENLLLGASVYIIYQHDKYVERQTNICYFDICNMYEQADYFEEFNACYCYEDGYRVKEYLMG